MSMDISGISSMLDYTSKTAGSSKASGLESTLKGDLSTADDEKLMSVCKEFEAYFVEMVMKEVEKTIPKNEDEDSGMSQMKDYFKDEMIQMLAEDVCEQQDLGLAQQMYEQMKRNYSI